MLLAFILLHTDLSVNQTSESIPHHKWAMGNLPWAKAAAERLAEDIMPVQERRWEVTDLLAS